MSEVPLYDPEVHKLDDDPTVHLAMYCACGGVFTQIDPVSECLRQIADFKRKHSGQGHGSVSPKECLEEREARRGAGFRSAGRQGEYKPKKRTVPKISGFDWSRTNG